MDINIKEAGFKINNDGFHLNILLILKLRGFFLEEVMLNLYSQNK